MKDCDLCGGNSDTSGTKSTSHTDCKCNQGYTGVDGSVECQACAAGTYKNSFGDAPCTACAAGQYQDAVAKSICEDCTNGKTSEKGANSPVGCVCDNGKFLGNDACVDCPAGKYKTLIGDGISLCWNCEAGKARESNSESATVCNGCTTGKYSEAGFELCSLCPDSNATTTKNDAQESDCVCKPGYHKNHDGQNCLQCPAGTYKKENANFGCEHCDPGFVSEPGAESCTSCERGKFSGAGAFPCQNCTAPPGKHCPAEHHDSQGVDCPEENYCIGGADSPQPCDSGTVSGTGQSACTSCTFGKFADGTTCSNCPSGQTSYYRTAAKNKCFDAGGSKNCVLGFFKVSRSSSECKPCSFIGDVEEYQRNWTRSYRYTLQEETLPSLLQEWTSKLKNEQKWGSYRFQGPREVHKHCGIFNDAVTCPVGTVYHKDFTPPCKYHAPLIRPRCQRGEYYNPGDFQCTQCPDSLYTLREDSIGIESCSYCKEGMWLNESRFAPPRCEPCSNCRTTVAYGQALAHRMKSCDVPRGPKHMHPDVKDKFKCDIFECLEHVRAQDIHECVFPNLGANMANRSQGAEVCHPYFRPIRHDWLSSDESSVFEELMQKRTPDQADIRDYSSPFDETQSSDPYLLANENGINVVRGGTSNTYSDFFYFYFATNTITDKYRGTNTNGLLHSWPQILAEGNLLSTDKSSSTENSSTFVIETYLKDEPLLIVKHINVLESDTSGGEKTAFLPLSNHTMKWPHVDFVRLSWDYYIEHYLRSLKSSCDDIDIKGSNRVYHCNERLFTTNVHIEDFWTVHEEDTSQCNSRVFKTTDACQNTYDQSKIEDIFVSNAAKHYSTDGLNGTFLLNVSLFREFRPMEGNVEFFEFCLGDKLTIRDKLLANLSMQDTSAFSNECDATNDANKWYYAVMCGPTSGTKLVLKKVIRSNPVDYFLKKLSSDTEGARSPQLQERDFKFSEDLCNADMAAIEQKRKQISVEHEHGLFSDHNEKLFRNVSEEGLGVYFDCKVAVNDVKYPCHMQKAESGEDMFDIFVPDYLFPSTQNTVIARLSVCETSKKCTNDREITLEKGNKEIFSVGNAASMDFVVRYLEHDKMPQNITHNAFD